MKIDDKYRNKEINLIIKTQQEVNRYFKVALEQLAKEIAKNKWQEKRNKAFTKYLQQWTRDLNAELQSQMQLSIDESWGLAEKKAFEYAEYYAGVNAAEFMTPSKKALEAFTRRKIKGLSWSQKVWNMAKNSNSLIEDYVATGVLKGEGAVKMSRNLYNMMKAPQIQKVPQVTATGEDVIRNFSSVSEFLQQPPVYGQYKNPYKAILRMIRTETNASYLNSDFHQIQGQRFVVGRRIKLAPAHADFDICDTLAGDYPKTFIFEGWHPNCLCYAVSIRMTKEEFKSGAKVSKNTVTKVPAKTERLAKAIKEGTMGSESMRQSFWLRDNFTADGTPYKKVGGTNGVDAYKNKKDLSYNAKSSSYEKQSKI